MAKRTSEMETTPVRGKGGMIRRMLRYRWHRMSGMAPEDAEARLSQPILQRTRLSYRLAGVKRWEPRHAILANGFLCLYSTSKNPPPDPSDPAASPPPDLRLNLGMSIVEFEKYQQKVDVELGSGIAHHLAFPSSSRGTFDEFLLGLYYHRVFAQVAFLRGSGVGPLGVSAKANSGNDTARLHSALNAAKDELTNNFRKVKRSYIKVLSSKSPTVPPISQPTKKKSYKWRLFRRSHPTTPRETDSNEMECLIQNLETVLATVERIKSLLDTELARTDTASPVKPLIVRTTSEDVLTGTSYRSFRMNSPSVLNQAAPTAPPAPGYTVPSLSTKKTEQDESSLDVDSEKQLESEEEVEPLRAEDEQKIEVPTPRPVPVATPPVAVSDFAVSEKKEAEREEIKEAPKEEKKEVEKVKEAPKKKEEPAVGTQKPDDGKNLLKRKPQRERRRVLPAKMPPTLSITVSVVMRALAENSLPLPLFEPIGALQRMAEQVEYTELLDRALEERDPVVRMGLVVGFAVAGLAHTHRRTGKPFNPLLGETFAMDRWEDLGWRFFSEQVSHSPDISACCLEGRAGWILSGVLKIGRPKLSFTYVSILPSGLFQIKLFGKHGAGEVYRYQPLECRVTNPVSTTKRRLHNVGILSVSCSNGLSGWVKMEAGTVACSGGVGRGGKEKLATMEGNWSERLVLRPGNAAEAIPLFSVRPALGDEDAYYQFGLFTRQLNEEPTAEEARTIPPTDSRYRPDQRAYEAGLLEEAQRLKVALEEKQRARKRANASAPIRWFAFNPNDLNATAPNRLYWDAAANGFRGYNFLNLFTV